MALYNKKNPTSIEISYSTDSLIGCCGVLEIHDIYVYEEERFDLIEAGLNKEVVGFSTRNQAMKAEAEDMAIQAFGTYPIVIMTDKVGGTAHKLMRILNPPGYSKKYTYSKVKNPNSGNTLVMCTWIKEAKG